MVVYWVFNNVFRLPLLLASLLGEMFSCLTILRVALFQAQTYCLLKGIYMNTYNMHPIVFHLVYVDQVLDDGILMDHTSEILCFSGFRVESIRRMLY